MSVTGKLNQESRPPCTTCNGEGWVCEAHPGKPWNDDGCTCSAGMPCECNPCGSGKPPTLPPGARIIVDREGWRN